MTFVWWGTPFPCPNLTSPEVGVWDNRMKGSLPACLFFPPHRLIAPRTVEKNAHRICILLTLPASAGQDWDLSLRLPLFWKITCPAVSVH